MNIEIMLTKGHNYVMNIEVMLTQAHNYAHTSYVHTSTHVLCYRIEHINNHDRHHISATW